MDQAKIVILGGGMAAVADLYVDALQQAMFERAQPLAAKKVSTAVSKIADTANLLGCARLAWDSIMDTENVSQQKISSRSSRKKLPQVQKEAK